MKFLIIIPTHNEEKNILFTLESLARQTYQNFLCVVVNDGSTDDTRKIAENFIKNHSNFRLENLEKSQHEPGAKVVRTFNFGLKTVGSEDFDIICKFDSDIIFPDNYLQEIMGVYQSNPQAGMVSGLVRIAKMKFDSELAFDFKGTCNQWKFENISSGNHVRGPIKSYRKTCFLAMNGLRPVLGWDNIDVMLAQKAGWQTITVKELWVKHLRPTAYQYKSQKAQKLGEYFYNIGLNLPLAVISAAKSAMKDRSLTQFLQIMKSFLKQNGKRQLTADEIKYIRKLRWTAMQRKFF